MQEDKKMKKVLVFFLGQGSNVDLAMFEAVAQREVDREIVMLLSHACETDGLPAQIGGRPVTMVRTTRFSQDPNADYLMVTGNAASRTLIGVMKHTEVRDQLHIPIGGRGRGGGGLTGDVYLDVP